MSWGIFVRLFILNTFVSITVFPQVKTISESDKIKPDKVVKIRTTVTPRKSNVVFVGKAMEVIITPLDEFNNEIKEIPSGLQISITVNDLLAGSNQIGKQTIYGKTYLYLTPIKAHSFIDSNALKVGAFLIDSITGIPIRESGEYVNVIVEDHLPVPPYTSSIQIINEQTATVITNNQVKIQKNSDKFTFKWMNSCDINDSPLKKSYATDPNDTAFWIQDQCRVKYKFQIEEYPDFKVIDTFAHENRIVLSGKHLKDVFSYVRQGSMKSVIVHCFLICEDDVYKYANHQYGNKLVSDKKLIELIDDGTNCRCEVNIDDVNTIPDDYYLAQNYPNPFNPSTNIIYALPKESHVQLIVYDIFGRQVRTLVNEKQSTGYKNISWNGKNDKGMTVSSGTYIYTITAGDFVQVKKMHLIK
jgi:hypothetical protein